MRRSRLATCRLVTFAGGHFEHLDPRRDACEAMREALQRVTYDVVVVGLGGVGSAAAAALARRGSGCSGSTATRPAHDQGASHGETRIVRKAYFEGAGYVPLLHRAYELWDELGLLTRTGGLFLGEESSRVLGGSLATAQHWDLPHELLDAAEVSRRFPAFTPPPGTVGLLEQDAGWCRRRRPWPRSSSGPPRAGADLRHEEPVTSWTETAGRRPRHDGARQLRGRRAGARPRPLGGRAAARTCRCRCGWSRGRSTSSTRRTRGLRTRRASRSGSGSAPTAPPRTASRCSAPGVKAAVHHSTVAAGRQLDRRPTWPGCSRRCCRGSATASCGRCPAPTR